MKWQYLINDVISHNRKMVYGKKNEKVYIVANHNTAVIVCNDKGEKYSTNIQNLKSKK